MVEGAVPPICAVLRQFGRTYVGRRCSVYRHPCPLLGVERTSTKIEPMIAIDPLRRFALAKSARAFVEEPGNSASVIFFNTLEGGAGTARKNGRRVNFATP